MVGLMNKEIDILTDLNKKIPFNFGVQLYVLRIGVYPTKIDRIIKNAVTKAEGYILIESILN